MTTEPQPWAKRVDAITLFVEDLAGAKAFYQRAFGLPVFFEDDSSVVFDFGNAVVNLLRTSSAIELVAPARPGGAGADPRMQLTLEVDDVDATCSELARNGVPLLNGPMDRPWGIRTASFRDPAGHVWEIAAKIER
jgi:catechol 2,3-dioxygenase-like lactoylglutathione lyase family enzyme